MSLTGYLALALSLGAMGFTNMFYMRIVHSCSAIAYIIYGYQINALPILIGGMLFLIVHAYHLRVLFKRTST